VLAILLGSVDIDEHSFVFSVYFQRIITMGVDDGLRTLIGSRSE
jgi:hypothetical protein